MFGRRYFGGRYFAPRYFGDGGIAIVVALPISVNVVISVGNASVDLSVGRADVTIRAAG